MFEKRIKELISRGGNLFVGDMHDGKHIVILKTTTSSVYGVMVTGIVPSLGILQSTLLLETEDKINITFLRETIVYILKTLGISLASSINVAALDTVKTFDKTIYSDMNKECVANSFFPMTEKEVLLAVDLWGFKFVGTYNKIEVDNSIGADAVYNKYDKALLNITPRIRAEMSINHSRMLKMDIEDNNELMNTFKLLYDGHILGLTALGEAATGKTTAFYKMCDLAGAYGVMVNGSTNLDEDFMFGSERLNTNPDIDSQFVWKDGLFTQAYENGWWLLMDEANMIQDGGIIAPMNNALEYPFKLVLNNGRVVDKHPNFRIVLAFNPGYKHTYPFNAAFANRFRFKLRFPDVTLGESKVRLEKQHGFTNFRAVEKLWDVYAYIKGICLRDQLDHVVSYRNIEAAVLGIVETGDVRNTIKQTMVEAIYFEERDASLASDLMDTLNKEILELERVFTGKLSSSLGEINAFDFSPEVNLDNDDVDDILSELDNM